MGLCFSRRSPVKTRVSKRICNSSSAASSSRWSRVGSIRKKDRFDDAAIHEQALAAAILFQQHRNSGGSLIFDRSSSVRHSNSSSRKQQGIARSSSSRARSLADPLLHPHQLTTKDVKLEGLECKHFVLVHGGGFGAWCWYKSIALLEESGFTVSAIDLTGSGIHSFDTNTITSLSQYVKPLIDFLQNLPDNEKVILVGHDFGGACISYATELFPSKVSKSIYIAAAMLTSGQSTLDMFSQNSDPNASSLMQQAQKFVYANGKTQPPTAIDLDKTLLKDLLFNQTSAKDVALACVSMRSIPFSPVLEKLSLSDANYGSVKRFYIQTLEDNAVPVSVQENMINNNPPQQIFRLRGSDHSPFFSRPQALHKLLVEIAMIQ